MSSDFDFNHEREVEQLRIAIEFHLEQIGRLESRIRELQEEQDEPSFAEFFGLTQEEADAARNAAEQFAAGEFEDEEEDDDYLDDIFEPEDKFPPQFHFDYLNMELSYDIEQADGFFDLSWKEQCDLVELAAEHDLELSEVETILDLQSEGDSR